MSKSVEYKLNNFSGGISDSPREENATKFQLTSHFDIFSDPTRMIPYRSLEADTTTSVSATDLKQYVAQDHLYAAESTKLYALGQTGAGLTKILQKDDATTGLWTTPATSEGDGAVQNGCLVEYKNYLWGFQGTTQVFSWGLLDGTPAITNSAGTVGSITNAITTVSVTAGGTGYNVGDLLAVKGGLGGSVVVATVSSGVVATITLSEAGRNYTTGTKDTTSAVGTGCTINITAVGDISTPITSVAQGLIARDDNLYLPYNNTLARVYNTGYVQDTALVLPTNLKITSITNFGNYLAIGCAPVSTFNGVSKVYLWDLIQDDIQEVIDWGEGELRILETVEGMIVGVTDRYLNNDTGAGRGSMIVQIYQGGSPQVIKEVFTEALTGKTMPLSKAVKNNRLFFAAKIMSNTAGTEYKEGIWSFGRKNVNYPFSLTLDVIDENINTSGIQSFGTAANFFFITHSGDGSVDKTDDTEVFNFTSTYISQIFNFGDVNTDKTLQNIKVSFARLLTGQSLIVKYRVDGNSAWSTIGSYSTVGGIAHTFLNIEGDGLAFASGREYEFRLESNGGLEITGFTCSALINNAL